MLKKRDNLTALYPRIRKTIGCALLGLVASVATIQTANAQGDNMCPRGVYVSIHASKDVGGESMNLVDDPTFTIGTFINTFGKFFSSPRLSLKPSMQPEYSLTVTFVKIKARRGDTDRSLMAIVLGFIGGDPAEDGQKGGFSGTSSDDSRVPIYCPVGEELLQIITEAKGFDPASHVPLVQIELSKQKSVDDIIIAYEQIPIRATVDEDPWCGYDPNNPNPYKIDFNELKTGAPRIPHISYNHTVRFIAKAEKGLIENGDFLKDDPKAKVFWLSVFDLSDPLTIWYRPPDGPDQSDTITLYNSCEIRYERAVPLNETTKHTKIAEMRVNCRERWSVELTFTKKVAGKEQMSGGMTREVGWSYSATVKAVVEFVKSSGSDQIYESKSADLDFNETFWQHIVHQSSEFTCEGRISWTGTHNGKIRVPVRMMIHTRAGRCSFGFGRREGDPIIFNIGINLWGDERCGGAKAWQGESPVKDVLFDASGVDLENHIPKPIPFSPGQKEISGQDQWSSRLWLRFYEVRVPIDLSQFPVLSRPLLLLLITSPMMSDKIPANATLSLKATKLGQKD